MPGSPDATAMASATPPRVCMLTTGFPRFDGDLFGSFIFELARQLTTQGVSVNVVAPHEQGLPRAESMYGVGVSRFRYFLPARWQRLAYGGGMPANLRSSWVARGQVPLFLLGFLWRALQATRRCQVVHCHWTITGLVGWCCARVHRRPVVLSVRGSDLNLLDGAFMRRLNRVVFGLVDAVVTVSVEMRQRIVDSGVEGTRVTVIPNGVGERFAPGDRAQARFDVGLPTAGVVAGFVGLLAPVKGLDVLIDALSQMPDSNLHLVLVGDGALRGPIEARAAELGLAERVRFVGRRPSGEIPKWLNAFDFLVLPSLSEGRPNVVLEALSCGTPVVATRVGGTPELVEHGVTGLLVEAGDSKGLAGAMAAMTQDTSRREAMGLAGRRWIGEQGLTWEACADSFLALYRQLTRSKRNEKQTCAA